MYFNEKKTVQSCIQWYMYLFKDQRERERERERGGGGTWNIALAA